MDQRLTSTLGNRLRHRIREQGPVPFAEFMEAALYDPDDGFYQRDPGGGGEHFLTSPRASPAFGVLVARQVGEFWALLDRPDPFVVVEVGAGDGTLARQIVEFVSPDLHPALRYVAAERGSAGREAMAGLDVVVVESVEEAPDGFVGCVIANELMDNVPFHWLRREEDGLVEIRVGLDGDAFVPVPGPLSSSELEGWGRDLNPGQERLAQVEAGRLFERAAARLGRGYLWLVDYGFGEGGRPTSPHGYRRHRQELDLPALLADPGTHDITAGVEFGPLVERARAAGLAVWGPVRQREALMALGYRDLEESALSRQGEALNAGRGGEAVRIRGARSRAELLIDPAGLGGFLVLGAGRGVDVPPSSFRR
jgi:SAM-dependent MidA family methyltransferase